MRKTKARIRTWYARCNLEVYAQTLQKIFFYNVRWFILPHLNSFERVCWRLHGRLQYFVSASRRHHSICLRSYDVATDKSIASVFVYSLTTDDTFWRATVQISSVKSKTDGTSFVRRFQELRTTEMTKYDCFMQLTSRNVSVCETIHFVSEENLRNVGYSRRSILQLSNGSTTDCPPLLWWLSAAVTRVWGIFYSP